MKKETAKHSAAAPAAQNHTPSAAGRMSETRLRILFIGGVFLLLMIVVVARLWYLQIDQYETYTTKVLSQQLRDTTITANRGAIYDCNMKVLASSATVWNIVAAPNEIETEDETAVADILCEVLEDVDREKLLTALANKNSAYYMVQRRVGKDVTDAVREKLAEKELGGIRFEQTSKRYYPYGAFASNIIGFVGTDNQGLTGVERYYDEELSGVDGRVISAKDGWGEDMDYEYQTSYPATDGYSLVLTIDEVIQHYLEKYLEQAVAYHNVREKGVGIVMDVDTFGILAMATIPDYDLNDPFTLVDAETAAAIAQMPEGQERSDALVNAREAQWRNKAVSDLYEPGSVFKIVTAASALDSGAATLGSSYSCAGAISVEGVSIRCSHTSGHGVLSFGEALKQSCNPSFIQIGQQMGVDSFCDYLNAFGLTERTGIDLPGESRSIVYNANTMGPVELASCSFGQSNKITPIQMITAVCASVNGGYLGQPHVVSQILNAEGEIVQNMETTPRRQVVSEDVSLALREILEDTVSNGPGNLAYVLGYRVGGKSGTSEKLDKQQTEEEKVYIASFVGVAPADDPKIAVLVILDEPDSYSYYGGQLSAPVVGSVMADVLPYLGVEASYSQDEMESVEVGALYCVGRSVTDAQVNLQKKGLVASVQGDGTHVVAQFPAAGTSLRQGSTVVLYTVEDESQTNLVTVPDLQGCTAGVAEQRLAAAGLNFSRTGSYRESSSVVVDAQSVEAGMQVPAGSVITVNFTDNSLVD